MLTDERDGSKYVPPYDSKEKHLPGYNYCGPGTNVFRRQREGVQPVNVLDHACMIHDIELEERGPQTVGSSKKALRASDKKLSRAALRIAFKTKSMRLRAEAFLVHRAMESNRWRKSRGGLGPK